MLLEPFQIFWIKYFGWFFYPLNNRANWGWPTMPGKFVRNGGRLLRKRMLEKNKAGDKTKIRLAVSNIVPDKLKRMQTGYTVFI